MPMTTDAKRALSTTIRALRAHLLQDLHAATESSYRLSIRRAQDAGLDEATGHRRRRLEAWIAEQERAENTNSRASRTHQEFRAEAEKQAAYTLLNRLLILRLMEAPSPNGRPLRTPALVTGGWESRAYQDFRQLAPALVRDDESEGYAFLLHLAFEDLATELPGLYGPAGVADLIPIPTATLRHVIEELDKPELLSCWTDDMTLGWVYQYWNDPAREALDAKLNGGGKLEAHEIASKTQMFTERYMVDWLLQNSLGSMWLAMCQKHGWTPAAEADGTLQRLEERRAEWRAKRAAGEVALTDLMPLHTEMERRWAYYVPQPIPAAAVTHAPTSLRDLKLLDPAVGSGHFLLVALTLLVALYHEEAHHRGEVGQPDWTDRAIVERILSHNLHAIDLDPRAVQIAAAALWIKARQLAPDAQPERLNLVAANLRLAALPDDDPALVELRREVEQASGIPARLTNTIVQALRGADHLGSLLRVNQAVDQALDRFEAEAIQSDLFAAANAPRPALAARSDVRATLLDRLDRFLASHTAGDDLGLRLRGEQLAAGVRFVRIAREQTYDLVVANPPYQGTAKMLDAKYIEKTYPLGKADLYAAFLLRGLELVREGGVSAMLTMRNWMFIKQYAELRQHLLERFDLRALGDFDRGAFEEIAAGPGGVSVAISAWQKTRSTVQATAIRPSPIGSVAHDLPEKRAATLCHVGRHEFDPAALKVVPEWPLVYWWDESFVQRYSKTSLLGDKMESRVGLRTSNNQRFVRRPWEIAICNLNLSGSDLASKVDSSPAFVPYLMGAAGRAWCDNVIYVILWDRRGLQVCVTLEKAYGAYPQSSEFYFRRGIAYTTIGATFRTRVHRIPGIFDVSGASVFPDQFAHILCYMNSSNASFILTSLAPTVNFQPGDIDRLPLFTIKNVDEIFAQIESAFTLHESHREPSVEFRQPGPSPWRHAQEWAQTAVDRPEGAPLPPYVPVYDPEPPTDHLSFALGVALGRFGPHGEGILDPAKDDLAHALPHGLLFLDGTLDAADQRDSLGHPAAARLHAAWQEYSPALQTRRKSLRHWLAEEFFKEVHKDMYENRPIHWPLSSAAKTFVAWVNIHRFTAQTLTILLADHLVPTLSRIQGELSDLRTARDSAEKRAAHAAEQRYSSLLRAEEELNAFIERVTQCAQRGAPPTDAKCPVRERDAPYAPDLDDGVMINAAALWPLLDPHWKEPKKWWKELSSASGRKDYDWAHLAMRYWPTRVDAKCQADPSLAVAHGCFWRYHPARAWAWELRLQDEIAPDFRITEAPYRPGGNDLGASGDGPHRDAWLRNHPQEALAAVEKEAQRRMGRGRDRRIVATMPILERGLWSVLPAQVWEMELRLAEKQRAEFRLLSPDEAEARAAYAQAHPQRVSDRVALLERLASLPGLFDDAAADSDDGDGEDAADPEAEDEDEGDDA